MSEMLTNDELRLHFGELSADECRLVKSAMLFERSRSKSERLKTGAVDDNVWSDGDMTREILLRDKYHDMADKLSNAIARFFDTDIGEHSNMNCPWENALEAFPDKTNHVTIPREVLAQVKEALDVGLGDILYVADATAQINRFKETTDSMSEAIIALAPYIGGGDE